MTDRATASPAAALPTKKGPSSRGKIHVRSSASLCKHSRCEIHDRSGCTTPLVRSEAVSCGLAVRTPSKIGKGAGRALGHNSPGFA